MPTETIDQANIKAGFGSVADDVNALNKRIDQYAINVRHKKWGVKGDGISDDRAALQAVINFANTNNKGIFIPSGTYLISGKLSISPNQVIKGEGKRKSVIINTNDNQYALECITPLQSAMWVVESEMVLQNFCIYSKYGIRFNQSGDYNSIFSKQGIILKPTINNLFLRGKYGLAGNIDPNILTATAISQAALEAYGVGIKASATFEGTFDNLYIQGFGTSISFDGCDSNKIDTCRMESCGRCYYHYSHDTFGSRNLLINNFYCHARRVGSVYLEGTTSEHFVGGYFENYYLSATYIKESQTKGTLYDGVHFDNTKQATPIFDLAPSYGLKFANCRFTPDAPAQNVIVSGANWGVAFPCLIESFGNAFTFPEIKFPAVRTKLLDKSVFNAFNFDNIGGVGAASFPFILSAVTGNYCLQTTTQSIIFSLVPRRKADIQIVEFFGRTINAGAGSYCNITWGGTNVFSNHIGFVNATGIEKKTATITMPAGKSLNDTILIELVNIQAEYYEVALTN